MSSVARQERQSVLSDAAERPTDRMSLLNDAAERPTDHMSLLSDAAERPTGHMSLLSDAAERPTGRMSLLSLQQNFCAWLTSEAAEAAAQFGERARAGLSVYLNNYRAQLLASLSASYPVLRAWMGDTRFESAAATHIDSVLPHSWTLDAYGLDFPETLERLSPAEIELAELARLERELGLAFVGPDAASVRPADLTGIDWETAIVDFVPTFRRLWVSTNAAAIWSAISNGETPPPAAFLAERATLVIWRHDLAPEFRTASPEEAEAFGYLRAGQTFGSLCATLVERLGEEEGPALAGSLLGQWLSDGLIARIHS